MRKSYEEATGYCTAWCEDHPENGVTLALVRSVPDEKGNRISFEPLAKLRLDQEKLESLICSLEEKLHTMKGSAAE